AQVVTPPIATPHPRPAAENFGEEVSFRTALSGLSIRSPRRRRRAGSAENAHYCVLRDPRSGGSPVRMRRRVRPHLGSWPAGRADHPGRRDAPLSTLRLLSFAMLEHCFEFVFKRPRRNSECAKSRPALCGRSVDLHELDLIAGEGWLRQDFS